MPRYELLSCCEDDTLAIGRQIGAQIPNGVFIAITGDHHAGKTLLVRGIANGLDVPGWAALRAPARTLMSTYHGGRCVLHHIDFYHLNQAPELPERLEEAMREADTVAIVEWADIMRDLWPDQGVIEIEMRVNEDGKRVDVIEDPDNLCPDFASALAQWLKPSALEGGSATVWPSAASSGTLPVVTGDQRAGADRRHLAIALTYGERRHGDRRRAV